MANVHPPEVLYQGETLEIEGELHKRDGSPLDLSAFNPATDWITWRMQKPDGTLAFDLAVTNGITIIDAPNGKIAIVVDKDRIASLAPASYRDQCRAFVGGIAAMQWDGFIEVRASI